MIAVEHNRDAVMLGHQSNVMSSGDGSENSGLLLVVLDALAGQESRSAVADLDDDGRPGAKISILEGD